MDGYQSDQNYWNTRGDYDVSGNPPFPVGKRNDVYVVKGSGFIGINGQQVLANDNDILFCVADSQDGSYQGWIVIPHNGLAD